MGNAQTLVSRPKAVTAAMTGAMAAAVVAGAALFSAGCGSDGVTPLCTDVPTYDNRGTTKVPDDIVPKIDAASSDAEKCLTPTTDGYAGSGSGGAAGSGGSGGS